MPQAGAEGAVEVPTGDSVIEPGDKVIVFALPHARRAAERLVCDS